MTTDILIQRTLHPRPLPFDHKKGDLLEEVELTILGIAFQILRSLELYSLHVYISTIRSYCQEQSG